MANPRMGELLKNIEGSGDVPQDLIERAAALEDSPSELRKLLTDKVKPGKDTEVLVLRKGERMTLKAKWND